MKYALMNDYQCTMPVYAPSTNEPMTNDY